MSKIRSIDSSAFYGCERLEDITLPASLERISRYAFSGCRRLGKVVIPKNTEKIEHYAFEEAASSFEVKAGNPSYTARGGLLLDETKRVCPGTGEGERCRSYSGYREKNLLWCSDRNGISRNFPAGIR